MSRTEGFFFAAGSLCSIVCGSLGALFTEAQAVSNN